MNAIEIKNLCFNFRQFNVLKNINLKITQGEFIGILGPNGCGKSTLIKQILGILKPLSGTIKIFEKNISHYNHKTLGNIIGFVPQKSLLTMPLSVEDVLYMGRYSRLQSTLKGYSLTDKNEIEKIAQKLKISHLKNRDIQSLSGGEFQRVLLGRALASSPKILLLDEPTSALDINYAVEMMKICEEICIKEKITIIAVLHDLNLASLFCNKIFLLKKGEIIHTGRPKELFRPEILEEIYGFSPDVITHQEKPFIILKKE